MGTDRRGGACPHHIRPIRIAGEHPLCNTLLGPGQESGRQWIPERGVFAKFVVELISREVLFPDTVTDHAWSVGRRTLKGQRKQDP